MSEVSKRWFYVAETPSGELKRGVVGAECANEVAALLREQRYLPISIRLEKTNILNSFSRHATRSQQLRIVEAADFCRGFSDLLSAGVPVAKNARTIDDALASKNSARLFKVPS